MNAAPFWLTLMRSLPVLCSGAGLSASPHSCSAAERAGIASLQGSRQHRC